MLWDYRGTFFATKKRQPPLCEALHVSVKNVTLSGAQTYFNSANM